MSLATLGKRKHQILRDSGIEGEWVDGEYVPPVNKCVTIYANVQPSYGSPLLKHLPEGERDKESVLIFSNHHLYTATSGRDENDNPVTYKADILCYRGCKWEVSIVRPFTNAGTGLQHCEAIAVKLNDELVIRREGKIGIHK